MIKLLAEKKPVKVLNVYKVHGQVDLGYNLNV